MSVHTDQTGRTIILNKIPERIISLVPSQTELLSDLGLEQQVVGITKFCVHPAEWHRQKTRVGGTKNIHIQKIRELQPDLIIANKEENLQSSVEDMSLNYPVWVSDVNDLDSAIEMIYSVGEMTAKAVTANYLAQQILSGFRDGLKPLVHDLPTAYLIWKNPFMTVGADTFIHDMLKKCGCRNIFQNRNRYPVTDVEEIRNLGCRLLILSSEPYPFGEADIAELKSKLPDTKVLLADGEYFSWYGSRLLGAPAYFTRFLSQLNGKHS